MTERTRLISYLLFGFFSTIFHIRLLALWLSLSLMLKKYLYATFSFSYHSSRENKLNKLTSLPMCGFIAQLVEHRTGIAEVTGSNPVEALIFSGFYLPIAEIGKKITATIILHFVLCPSFLLFSPTRS